MPICSYIVFPEEGAFSEVSACLAKLPGCDVLPVEESDLMLLVTETDTSEQEAALHARIEALDGLRTLLLTFGEIEPDLHAQRET